MSDDGRYVGPRAVVIGGGPAGLMAAEVLSASGLNVDLFEAKPTVGRKFLMAGVGGMNITHSEASEVFVARYGECREQISTWLGAFGADELRAWLDALGIATFVGSSGRVFPTDMKAAPLLRAWLKRLQASGVTIHVRHRWLGWNTDGSLRIASSNGEKAISADCVVLALGGASWARLGADAAWVPWLVERGVEVSAFKPANGGFEVTAWTDVFTQKFAGVPLKKVALSLDCGAERAAPRVGELMVTRYGIEGSLVYAYSAAIREQIERNGKALVTLDLRPDKSTEALTAALAKPRGRKSMANHLRMRAGVEGVKAGLLRELASSEVFGDPARLAKAIKALPLELVATRPLDEAISSAGGVSFNVLDERLMLKRLPGIFCAGEMIDWEAPTGGYLLTACFASGRVAGQGALEWLKLLKR
ncbi:TIGR03862 family flavoprotein [Phytohalomonas tamaricis]|uniref:TIGR03862 family flavoprotein n=1 Tax=Phytohalomonas tamaricis TaxID=2081032 RepID=UPI000D0BC360|nr:TIGR03862 family flavoprotein [Phytohalomonas tamaricis]